LTSKLAHAGRLFFALSIQNIFYTGFVALAMCGVCWIGIE